MVDDNKNMVLAGVHESVTTRKFTIRCASLSPDGWLVVRMKNRTKNHTLFIVNREVNLAVYYMGDAKEIKNTEKRT